MSTHEALILDVARRAALHLDSLAERPVQPPRDAVALLRKALAVPLPEKGVSPSVVVAELEALGAAATVATPGPRYFGFVTGGALPATVAAGLLAVAWDQNAFSFTSSPAGALYEEAALRWLVDVLRLPAGTGALVSGATVANASCLAAARDELARRAGWDVQSDGLFGAPPISVLVGADSHSTLSKSLGLVGLGRNRAVVVPADDQGRLRASELPDLRGRCSSAPRPAR